MGEFDLPLEGTPGFAATWVISDNDVETSSQFKILKAFLLLFKC